MIQGKVQSVCLVAPIADLARGGAFDTALTT